MRGEDGPWAISAAETPHDPTSYSLYVKSESFSILSIHFVSLCLSRLPIAYIRVQPVACAVCGGVLPIAHRIVRGTGFSCFCVIDRPVFELLSMLARWCGYAFTSSLDVHWARAFLAVRGVLLFCDLPRIQGVLARRPRSERHIVPASSLR